MDEVNGNLIGFDELNEETVDDSCRIGDVRDCMMVLQDRCEDMVDNARGDEEDSDYVMVHVDDGKETESIVMVSDNGNRSLVTENATVSICRYSRKQEELEEEELEEYDVLEDVVVESVNEMEFMADVGEEDCDLEANKGENDVKGGEMECGNLIGLDERQGKDNVSQASVNDWRYLKGPRGKNICDNVVLDCDDTDCELTKRKPSCDDQLYPHEKLKRMMFKDGDMFGKEEDGIIENKEQTSLGNTVLSSDEWHKGSEIGVKSTEILYFVPTGIGVNKDKMIIGDDGIIGEQYVVGKADDEFVLGVHMLGKFHGLRMWLVEDQDCGHEGSNAATRGPAIYRCSEVDVLSRCKRHKKKKWCWLVILTSNSKAATRDPIKVNQGKFFLALIDDLEGKAMYHRLGVWLKCYTSCKWKGSRWSFDIWKWPFRKKESAKEVNVLDKVAVNCDRMVIYGLNKWVNVSNTGRKGKITSAFGWNEDWCNLLLQWFDECGNSELEWIPQTVKNENGCLAGAGMLGLSLQYACRKLVFITGRKVHRRMTYKDFSFTWFMMLRTRSFFKEDGVIEPI